MSAYLGWSEDKPSKDYVRLHKQYDTDSSIGGPITNSYEDYIKSIFKNSDSKNKDNTLPEEYRMPQGITEASKGISARVMLKMEQHFGKHALDNLGDMNLDLDTKHHDPLDDLYSEIGINRPKETKYSEYVVYKPKCSSEYFSTLNRREYPVYSSTDCKGAFKSFEAQDKNDWRNNDRQMLIDYKQFDSSPLSPYMYKDHQFLKNQDSRIVCSNFVQLTTRPKDRFLEKIDKTLAEVRAMPRYY
uniref:Peptidase M12A domain-containing protein n=1 Tax=Strongyloides papillosus TaxID=174720 RepID=A0A0N5C8L8_STREA